MNVGNGKVLYAEDMDLSVFLGSHTLFIDSPTGYIKEIYQKVKDGMVFVSVTSATTEGV